MTYTEFVCKPAGVDANASNLNGGSGGTPITLTGCQLSNPTTLLSAIGLASDPFGALVVGDWFTWDTAGAKNRGKVTSTSSWNGGTGQSTISVAQTDGGSTWVGVNRTCIFRGAWADPSMVASLTTLSVDAAGDPPRLNVLAFDGGGNQITYPVAVAVVNAGTASIPITVEGYRTAYGDLRGTMSCALVQLNSGIPNSGIFQINSGYVNVRNVSVATTQAGKHGFYINNVANVHLINCVSSAPAIAFYFYGGSGYLVDTCLITVGGNSIFPALFVTHSNGAAIVNVRVAGLNASALGAIEISYAQGTLISGCVFYNFTGDCIVIQSGNVGLSLIDNTANTVSGNFVNAGSQTDLSSLAITGSIFAGLTGKVVYSAAGSNVNLARFAHNMVYNCSWPYFSANVVSAVEDVNTTDNPFTTGETLSAAAKSHAILLADGITQTYPDYGAVQSQADAAGGLLVQGPMTGGMT